MKNIYSICLVACLFAMSGSYLKAEVSGTDTIHKKLTDFQCDSLIRANKANTNFYILDVRTNSEFVKERIANAHELDYFSGDFTARLSSLDRNIIYMVYCSDGPRSLDTYNKMIALRFREVYLMRGGLTKWKADSLPVVFGIVSSNERTFAGEKKATIYPVPACTELCIELADRGKYELIILDMNGRELVKRQNVLTDAIINISQLRGGFYYLKLTGEGEDQVYKFIKK